LKNEIKKKLILKKEPKIILESTQANISNMWSIFKGEDYSIDGKPKTIMKSNSWLTKCWGIILKKKVSIKKWWIFFKKNKDKIWHKSKTKSHVKRWNWKINSIKKITIKRIVIKFDR